MRGQTVEVGTALRYGTDAFGHPKLGMEWRKVHDVLFDPRPSGTDSSNADMHAMLVENTVAFHFPKGYGRSLENCRIRVNGDEYEVLGNPLPYPEELAPTRWNLNVKARRVTSG